VKKKEIVHRSDKEFTEKYKESHEAVVKVATWLIRKGFNDVEVEVQSQKLRPSVEEREAYMDDFDIHLKMFRVLKKIDVKGNPTRSFSKSNPWKFQSIICQSVYDVDRKGFPWQVYQVNKELTWAILMDIPAVEKHLFKRHIYNSSTKKKQWCWCAPMLYTTYIDLES
jgi:hypothetical protein